jgi:hypothetical protein
MTHAFDKLFARDDLPEAVRRNRRRAEANLHRMLAGSYFNARDPRGFVRNTARSVARDPKALGWYARLPLRRLGRA